MFKSLKVIPWKMIYLAICLQVFRLNAHPDRLMVPRRLLRFIWFIIFSKWSDTGIDCCKDKCVSFLGCDLKFYTSVFWNEPRKTLFYTLKILMVGFM